MNYCNICGAEISEADNFCKNCGNPIGENQNEEIPNESRPLGQKVHKQINVVGWTAFTFSLAGLIIMYFYAFFGWLILSAGGAISYYGRKREPKGIAIAATVVALIGHLIAVILVLEFAGIIKL
ncbi:MAG: hypothetical protein IKN94_07870 [Salinivirgaceae bacterium]|nr:hypothetical protein [Salinivirgaceae bacterium]